MAIVKMKKMHLLGLKNEQDQILDALQNIGVVEVSKSVEAGDPCEVQNTTIHRGLAKELSDLEQKLAGLRFGIGFLKPYVKDVNPLIHGKPKVNRAQLDNVIAEEQKYFTTVEALHDLDQGLSRLNGEETRIHHLLELFGPWAALDIPFEELGSSDKAEFVAASADSRMLEEFKSLITADEGLCIDIIVIGEGQDDTKILVIYHKSQKDTVLEYFKEYAVYAQDFSDYSGTPGQNIERCKERLAQIQKDREDIYNETRAMSDQKRFLEILYDRYSVELEKKNAILKASDTEKTFFIHGWLPESHTVKTKERLAQVSDTVYVSFSEPEEDDDIPVLLENSMLVTPFEAVTEMFSLPDPRGLDPNPLMAPFYFIFFGMMLSDAGYGIVLSLLTGLALWKLKLGGMAKKLMGLLFLGGISTVIWGAIYGGWFGDLIPIKPLWINPLDDPIAVLVLCLALGVVQIYTGILINAYKNLRAGKPLDALMDQGLWIVFLTGLLMFALPQASGYAKNVALAGAAGLVLTQGRAQKGAVMKLASGVLSLYGVTGYLSDVLSYSRLLALGIATGVIGVVINTMARMLGGNPIGIVAMVLILLGGHTFNIAINVLGSYVHSSRLQYIEYFGKFYDSGGKAFEPFRVKTTYVDIENH